MRDRLEKLGRVKAVHRHQWLWEPLESDPTFVLRPMFGTRAAYLGGKLVLCFCAREEPWRGLLVCTDHAHHAALRAEFPDLRPHPILPKWLYLPEATPTFESTGQRLVMLARQRDPRLGIIPRPRAKKSGSRKRRRSTRRKTERP
jgi:hypothetical protein